MPESTSPIVSPEQPLPPLRYGLYLLSASVLIAGFYFYCVATLLLGTLLWVGAVVLAFLSASYGGLTLLMPLLFALVIAMLSIARGLRLQRGVDFRVPLTRGEAPKLWSLIEDLSRRLEVSPPREIVLESGVNAWVQLLGVATGRGKSKLGIGFDLLAGLSPVQARAVIAHEIAHAKYVKRGYRGFLLKGLARAAQCSTSLQTMANDANSSTLAPGIYKLLGMVPKKIGNVGGKLVAACSRYDEFVADRVAAQICGSKVAREALLAVHVLDHQSENISWRERILYLEKAPGYTAWLRQTLRVPNDDKRLEIEARAFERAHRDEMNTHPALPDRVAVLESLVFPGTDWAPNALESGIEWLQAPDKSAKKLLREIEKIAEGEERKATQSLAKWMRKRGARNGSDSTRISYASILGIIWLFSLIGLLALADGEGWSPRWGLGLVFHSFAFATAIWLVFRPSKNVVKIPIPKLVTYRVTSQNKRAQNRVSRERYHSQKALSPVEKRTLEVQQSVAEEQKKSELGARLRPLLPPETKKPRAIAHFWTAKGADLLRCCDYDEAAHCARLALEAQHLYPEAMFIHAICGAFEGKRDVNGPLELALTKTQNPTGRWAMAWASCLLGETDAGEAFLLDLTRRQVSSATTWALLGQCQGANGKPREALNSHRRAVELAQADEDPDNEACHRLELARNLAALGWLNEARSELEWLRQRRENGALPGIEDFELEVEWLGWYLASGEVQRAIEMGRVIAARNGEVRYLIELGDALGESRDAEVRHAAQSYYERALESGFYPQVLMSLSKMAYDAGDQVGGRRRVLEALDTTRPIPFDAVHPLALLEGALDALRTLADSLPQKVTAFAVHLDVRETALELKKISLLCLFAAEREAQAAAKEVFAALLPAHKLEGKISCEIATPDMQPNGPAPPGIYYSAFDTE